MSYTPLRCRLMNPGAFHEGFRFRMHVGNFYLRTTTRCPKFRSSITVPSTFQRPLKVSYLARPENALVLELKHGKDDGSFLFYAPHHESFVAMFHGLLYLTPSKRDAVRFVLERVGSYECVYVRTQEKLRFVRYLVDAKQDKVLPESFVVTGLVHDIGIDIPDAFARRSKWSIEPVQPMELDSTEAQGNKEPFETSADTTNRGYGRACANGPSAWIVFLFVLLLLAGIYVGYGAWVRNAKRT